MTLDLQLSLYHPVCYNGRAHFLLLQCLHTTDTILAGAHSYFVVILNVRKKTVAMTEPLTLIYKSTYDKK